MDDLTARMITNASDEYAVSQGCFFSLEAAAWAVWWIQRHCVLYEGEDAGKPVLMRCGNPEIDQVIDEEWEEGGKEKSIQRLYDYLDWRDSEPDLIDWQYDCTIHVFGWQRKSERWNRNVRRFTQSSVWIPKKEKKTPTSAAWSMYLTCGDGEEGAKTFACAKDGNQARIAAKHAIAMVEQSDRLSSECKINQNESSITHVPTRSVYRPLSSNDSRHKQSKEGINGNISIDETHVVDREFVKIVSRAGISRSEPLRMDFSTAGNNPDGYGKERQDYVRDIISGAVKNSQVFGRIYEAPQDTADADIKADPIKYGKMANPSWGHTANEEEFLQDFEESTRSISEFADFKMYRLNIWQSAVNQWISATDWKANEDRFDIEDFAGEPVWLGLDLSKTRDMTSLSLVFREGNEEPTFYVYPMFWLPEDYAEEHKDKASWRQWAANGELTLIPGETIKQTYIKSAMKWAEETFDVRMLQYDKTYAFDLVNEFCIEELGWDCVDFGQSMRVYAGPTQTFEDLLVDRRLRHNGNSVLTWQAGHCETKTNDRGDRMPSKPKRDDYRKIDGIVATIMALNGAYHAEPVVQLGKFYADNDIETWIG